jgi:hypothetical protein
MQNAFLAKIAKPIHAKELKSNPPVENGYTCSCWLQKHVNQSPLNRSELESLEDRR